MQGAGDLLEDGFDKCKASPYYGEGRFKSVTHPPSSYRDLFKTGRVSEPCVHKPLSAGSALQLRDARAGCQAAMTRDEGMRGNVPDLNFMDFIGQDTQWTVGRKLMQVNDSLTSEDAGPRSSKNCTEPGDLSKAQDMSKLRKGETKEPCISSFCKKTEPLSTRQIFSFAVN
ncbi:hypothetical protein E5288_WYG001757 [Bos mutus]|uniref:Uncharacterized protein n=1 Tax=Bos mutus TaxID=72004 RepID=A0A6B0RN91_9CETA|nr:hypothetical protein [Bos mutus]